MSSMRPGRRGRTQPCSGSGPRRTSACWTTQAAVAALEGARPEPANLALRIRLLAMLNRDDEARAVLAALLAPGEPVPEEIRVELAAELRESGLVAEARRLLGPPTAGESPAAALERGRLLLAEGDYEGALPLLEAAAAAPRPPAGAAFDLGRLLARLGLREEAIPHLRRAAAESPDDAAVRFRLGQLLAQDPDPGRAAEGRRLLSGHEERRLQTRRLDLLLTRLNEHTVVSGSRIDRTPGLVTGSRDGWVALVGLLLDRGDVVEATRVVRAASARYPGDPAFEIGTGADALCRSGRTGRRRRGSRAPGASARRTAGRRLAERRALAG